MYIMYKYIIIILTVIMSYVCLDSGGQCLGTVRGYLRASVEDPATLHANYATMSGRYSFQ